MSQTPGKRKEISPLIEKDEKKTKIVDKYKNEKLVEKKIEELKSGLDINEKLNFLLDMTRESQNERRELKCKFENLCEVLISEREERRAEAEQLREEIKTVKSELSKCQEKLDELENRGRRSNLIFKGIEEQNEETWGETQELLTSVIKKHFDIELQSIGRAHRLGQYRPSSKYPRMIIARFEKEAEKKILLENKFKLKNTKIYIEEDYSQSVRDIRRELWKAAIEERKQGKRATVRYKTLFVDGEEFTWNLEKKQIEKIEKSRYNTNQKN